MTLFWPRDARENEALAEWCGRRIKHVGADGFGPCQAAAVVHGGHVAAVVVFHDWQDQERCHLATSFSATVDQLMALLLSLREW